MLPRIHRGPWDLLLGEEVSAELTAGAGKFEHDRNGCITMLGRRNLGHVAAVLRHPPSSTLLICSCLLFLPALECL